MMTSSPGASRDCLLRLAAHSDEPDRSRPVQGLFFRLGSAECGPDKPDLVAIDGKTSRRSHNRKTGQRACIWYRRSPPAAWLVLGREAVLENRIVERLDLSATSAAWTSTPGGSPASSAAAAIDSRIQPFCHAQPRR
jgi:hypothetical protein